MKKTFALVLFASSIAAHAQNTTVTDSLNCQAAAVGVFNALAQASFGIRGAVYTVDYVKKISEDANQVSFEAIVEGGQTSVLGGAAASKVMLGKYEVTMKNDSSMKCTVTKAELK